ncbi:PIH1 domain-containing protein 2 [Parambassis ranga]|uniref:PIH1 domain-containing protein 2 n=1 Tax=Parambassis ranga TaxID=210632 RepID=A0A6P7JFQ4_9TELE|nr:PIH1 domain-containing protein 2 [Parambassis ranga]
MSLTGGSEAVLQQISQFWSMLDDLSESDPAAYRSFIEKQTKIEADFSSPPELHSCLCSEIQEPKRGLLYINICSWKRVPAPQDPSRPLPVYGGKLETGITEGQGWYAVLDVALNPAVFWESKEDNREMNQVYMLALSFAQQQHGVGLSQQYTVVTSSPKSSVNEVYHRLGFKKWSNTSKQPETVGQTPAALLQQISALRSEKQDKDAAAQITHRPAERKKKDLIQVISTTLVEPQKPKYQLEVKTDTAGAPHSMELTVELPKVGSMSECQLRMSKEDILLEVGDVYYLLLEFPQTVNEDTASAIFNKKKRQLTLKVDVL